MGLYPTKQVTHVAASRQRMWPWQATSFVNIEEQQSASGNSGWASAWALHPVADLAVVLFLSHMLVTWQHG